MLNGEEGDRQCMEWKSDVINSVNEGILVVDAHLTFIFANQAIDSIGLSHEVIVGRNVFDVFPNIPENNSTFAHVIKTGESLINKSQSFVTYRGELKTTVTSTYPIKKGDKIIGAYEIFQDYSALQHVKDLLTELQKNKYSDTRKDNEKSPVLKERSSFIGEDEKILKIKKQIKLFANTQSPLLIYGETGTGKEVIVQKIHQAKGTEKPFVTQNCAAIPDNLLESYLFGTVKGSFTGALDQEGLFEIANGGILFLDEINSLSLDLQAKLLRVLQNQRVRRVGGVEEIPVHVRIIAATNVHPQILLANKEMRPDLFYRLNVLHLELPPLRERKQDIPLLVEHFISQYNREMNRNVKGVTDSALEYLVNYAWPGNVRELKNVIERFMNMVESDTIDRSDIELFDFIQVESTEVLNEKRKENEAVNFRAEVENLERKLILDALQATKGNISQAARTMDLPQQTLSNKIKKYGFAREIHRIKLLNYE